jgi:hypothetical protein
MGTTLEEAAIARILAVLTSDRFKFPWQIGWLLNALCHAQHPSESVATFALRALNDDALPWFARGQAAVALAVHGKLPRPTEYVETYELSPRAVRPDLVAAVAVGEPPWRNPFLEAVAADSPVLAAVQELPHVSFREWL